MARFVTFFRFSAATLPITLNNASFHAPNMGHAPNVTQRPLSWAPFNQQKHVLRHGLHLSSMKPKSMLRHLVATEWIGNSTKSACHMMLQAPSVDRFGLGFLYAIYTRQSSPTSFTNYIRVC